MPDKALTLLLVFLAMSIESFAQVAFKIGAGGGSVLLVSPFRRWVERFRLSASSLAWIVLGSIFYVGVIFLWTLVLHRMDVSAAFPMGSLCFVGVALWSKIFLDEAVGAARWMGVFFILAGTFLLAF